LASWGYV